MAAANKGNIAVMDNLLDEKEFKLKKDAVIYKKIVDIYILAAQRNDLEFFKYIENISKKIGINIRNKVNYEYI